jgi:hypothetical protein
MIYLGEFYKHAMHDADVSKAFYTIWIKKKKSLNSLCGGFKVALYKNWYFFIKIFFNQFLFYYNILDTQVKK